MAQRRSPLFPITSRPLGWLVILLGLAGCVSAPSGEKAVSPRAAVWPAPPDPPRFAFEALLRSRADIRGSNNQESLRRLLTSDTSDQGPAFEKVSAVAAAQGRIYAADSVKRRIVVFDAPRQKVFVFGLRNPGELQKPLALALDDAGNVYVADAGRRRILVYDPLGLHLKTLGDTEDLGRPTGVAVSGDGSRIYVVDRADNDSERHRIVILDSIGRKIGEFGRRGSGPGEFNIPVQAAVGPDGRVYVLDAGNFRIQIFAPDGQFLHAFGRNGTAVGSFARPRGLALDRNGHVYVSDAFFGNFQIFDPSGELLLAVGQLSPQDAPGHYGLISGLAVDETGRVYVADQLFNKIEVIKPLATLSYEDSAGKEQR